MPKKANPNPKPNPSADSESGSECLQLLAKFVEMFQTIPQNYCLFCEANTALGVAAHRETCPFRLASELTKNEK
jgi:hypothetical protein